MRETLREKLDLEKRALQVVERLLEDSVADDFLVDCVSTVEVNTLSTSMVNTAGRSVGKMATANG